MHTYFTVLQDGQFAALKERGNIFENVDHFLQFFSLKIAILGKSYKIDDFGCKKHQNLKKNIKDQYSFLSTAN